MDRTTIVLTGGYEVDVQGDAEAVAQKVTQMAAGTLRGPGWAQFSSPEGERDVYVFIEHVIALRAHAA